MGLNTDIRQIAREVFRDEIKQLELALRTGVTSPALAEGKAQPLAPAATRRTLVDDAAAKGWGGRRGNPGRPDTDPEAPLLRSVAARRLLTVPEAQGATGIPARTLRAWIKGGRLPERVKNTSANPKRRIFLVDIEEVHAVVAAGPTSETGKPVKLAQERATRVAASIMKNLEQP